MASFCSNCDEMICACSHPNCVPRYELTRPMCEWIHCKRPANNADTYQNMWFCDDHYSRMSSINDDYQGEKIIDYETMKGKL